MPTLKTVPLKALPTVIPSVLAPKTESVLEGHQPSVVLSALEVEAIKASTVAFFSLHHYRFCRS